MRVSVCIWGCIWYGGSTRCSGLRGTSRGKLPHVRKGG